MTKFDIIFTILILIIFGFIGAYFVKTNQNLRVLQNELSYLKNESLALKVSDSTLDQSFSTLNDQFWLKEQNRKISDFKMHNGAIYCLVSRFAISFVFTYTMCNNKNCIPCTHNV